MNPVWRNSYHLIFKHQVTSMFQFNLKYFGSTSYMAKFQVIHSRGYKGHMQAWQRNYLADKEVLFNACCYYLKCKSKTSGLTKRFLGTRKAGWNIAQKTQVHSIHSYSTWELNLWTSSEALTRSMEDMEEERL